MYNCICSFYVHVHYIMYMYLGLVIEQWDRIDYLTTPTLIKISTNKDIVP